MDLPLTYPETREFSSWLKNHFGREITAAFDDLPFDLDIVCAIACQETGVYALPLARKLPPERVLARCVFDASGDYPASGRDVFPVNTSEFRERFGDEFTDKLIDEANHTRALRGYGPTPWVYKRYGIFRYDLHNVTSDESFFRNRLWADMNHCARRLATQLRRQWANTDDYWRSIAAYHGAGPDADQYMEQVREYLAICQTT